MKARPSLLVAVGFAVATLLAAPASLAALYKWLDENGRVVYGDTPPAGVKADRLSAAAPPADPGAVRDMASKDAELRKRQQQRVDDAAKADKDQADLVKRRAQCQAARNNILTLRNGGNVYRYNEKGERVFFEAADRERAIAENQVLIRDLGCAQATGPG
jgi:phage pi2 protein 07